MVPYVDLAPEVRAALEADGLRPRYVDVSDHDWAYWRLLRDLWAARATVVVVEHDVIPPPGGVRAMLDCPSDWCAHEYRQGHLFGTGFGCTKFSAALMARVPTAVNRILPQHRGWNGLDSMVTATLRRNGEPEHLHTPRAGHLHYAADGTSLREPVRRRNATLTSLLYVGTGRYIDGVPRRDFDSDDPSLIARCLESGLYVALSEETGEPEVPESPTEPAPADEPVNQ